MSSTLKPNQACSELDEFRSRARARGTRSDSTNQNFGNNESVMWKNIQRNQNLPIRATFAAGSLKDEEGKGSRASGPAAPEVNTSAQRHKSSVFLRVHERLKHAPRPPDRDCRRPRSSNINAAASAARERGASLGGTRVLRTIQQPAEQREAPKKKKRRRRSGCE